MMALTTISFMIITTASDKVGACGSIMYQSQSGLLVPEFICKPRYIKQKAREGRAAFHPREAADLDNTSAPTRQAITICNLTECKGLNSRP